MADEFDPYYTWLGIPPEEQPATHYRLLGVREFEPNLDVISNAGDQRMAFLRTFQVGKRSALSQRLLNEMAAAKVCLLDADQRKAYDAKLKASKPRSPTPAPQVAATPNVVAAPQVARPPMPALAPRYSPPTLAPLRQIPVAQATPVVPRPSVTPEPFAAVDPFADVAKEFQSQPILPPKPVLEASDDIADQAMALVRAAVSRLQESPLATAAYGMLALGVVMFLSVGLWLVFGRGQPAAVATASAASTQSESPGPVERASSMARPGSQAEATNSTASTATTSPKLNSSAANPTEVVPKPKVSDAADDSTSKTPMPVTKSDRAIPPVETVPTQVATPARNWTALSNVFPGRFPQPRKARLSLLTNKLAEFAIPSREVTVWPVPENVHQPVGDPLSIATQSNVQCVCFSRDERLLAIGTDNDVEFWDLPEQKRLWQITLPGPAIEVLFCNGEKQLAVACRSGRPLAVVNMATRAIIPKIQSSQPDIQSLAASDHWLTALGSSGYCSVYDLRKGIPHGDFHSGNSKYLSIYMRGDNLHAIDSESITTWDLRLRTTSQWRTPILKSHPHPDDLNVDTGIFTQQENGILSVFERANGATLGKISSSDEKVAIVQVGLTRLLTSGPDDQLLLWDIDKLKKTTGTINPAEEIPIWTRLPSAFDVAGTSRTKPLDPVAGPTSSAPAAPSLEAGMTPAEALKRLQAIGVPNLATRPEDVSFVGIHNLKFTDADVHCLAALPQLKNLYFSEVPVTGKTLQILRNCRNLEVLSLHKADIGDEDLAGLANVTTLKQLSVSETRVTAAGLEHLKNLSNLESLTLPQSVGREMIPYLAKFPKLRYLHPFPQGVTDEDMKVIGQLRSLETLDLQQAKLTAEGYKELANLTEVKYASISNLAPAGVMIHCAKMKLDSLGFPNSSTEKELELFQKMGTVRFLRPPRDTSDEGLQVIAKFSGLENVNLVEAKNITDAGLIHLAKMKFLKDVGLPPQIGDQGLINLSRSPSLHNISIHESSIITEKGLQSLVSLVELERITLPAAVNDRMLKSMTKCPKLKSILLYRSKVTADGLKSLQEFPQLEEINMIDVNLTAPGIEALKSLKGLTSVMLQQCSVSPEDAESLKAALPKSRVSISQ